MAPALAADTARTQVGVKSKQALTFKRFDGEAGGIRARFLRWRIIRGMSESARCFQVRAYLL